MSWKELLPLIGVIAGWVLSEFSKKLVNRTDDIKHLNRTIRILLSLRFEIMQFNELSDGALKVYKDRVKAEKERQRILEKHLFRFDDSSERLSDLLTNIASYDPILAIKIGHLIKAITKVKDLRLNESANVPNLYDHHLKIIIATQELSIKVIENTILSLSIKCNLRTWFRVRRFLKRSGPYSAEWPEIVKTFVED